MPVSADTLLRLLKHSAPPPAPTPRILGVDDFAFRRGHRYGTILVDLERHCPIDLLPDREAQSLADWLRAHPGVEIVARDRAGSYAEGAHQGAPEAVQVADRWHLFKNLREVLERLLVRHRRDLQAVSAVLQPPLVRPAAPPTALPEAVEPPPSHRARLREARRAHRRERYAQVVAWHQEGKSVSLIARGLRMCRGTVRRFLRTGEFPERGRQSVPPGKLAPFQDALRRHWEAGCHSAAALWRALKAEGFTGSPILVRRAVQPWRTELAASAVPTGTASIEAPSPHRVSGWLLSLAPERDAQTQAAHQRFVKALLEHSPELASAQPLAMRFADMIRHHQAGVAGADPLL